MYFNKLRGEPVLITARNLQSAWDQAIRTIWTSGDRELDQRGNKTREILNMNLHITGSINDYPDKCPCSLRYAEDFSDGLLSTRTAMKKSKEFDYSYGERIRKNNALDNVIDILTVEPQSRTCVLPVFNAADTLYALNRAHNTVDAKEVPCVIDCVVILRDNKLHMTLNMRSNDVLTAMPSDVYGFRNLQNYIATQIGAKVGTYTHNVVSAHIIEENGADFMEKYMKTG